ncbi:MAG: hypothetical protein ABEH47_02235 [Haloferacaceae archaeon]
MHLRRRLLWLLALLSFPHEWAHAVAFAPWAGWGGVEVLPAATDAGRRGLARYDPVVPEGTPLLAVRAAAVAPLPAFLGVAGVGAVALPRTPAVRVPAIAALAFWGSLSAGDLAVAADPAAAREAGEFTVPAAAWTEPAADVLTVLTVLAVAVVLL